MVAFLEGVLVCSDFRGRAWSSQAAVRLSVGLGDSGPRIKGARGAVLVDLRPVMALKASPGPSICSMSFSLLSSPRPLPRVVRESARINEDATDRKLKLLAILV